MFAILFKVELYFSLRDSIAQSVQSIKVLSKIIIHERIFAHKHPGVMPAGNGVAGNDVLIAGGKIQALHGFVRVQVSAELNTKEVEGIAGTRCCQ